MDQAIVQTAIDHLQTVEQDLLFRWVQRVSRFAPYLQRPETSLQQIMDHVPQVLQHLCQLSLQPVEPPAGAVDAATGHALERKRLGVPARMILKEYQVLRNEIWIALRNWQPPRTLTAGDVFLLEERINFAMDEIIALTLDSYVDLESPGHDQDA
jgi:hypothetical protein